MKSFKFCLIACALFFAACAHKPTPSPGIEPRNPASDDPAKISQLNDIFNQAALKYNDNSPIYVNSEEIKNLLASQGLANVPMSLESEEYLVGETKICKIQIAKHGQAGSLVHSGKLITHSLTCFDR